MIVKIEHDSTCPMSPEGETRWDNEYRAIMYNAADLSIGHHAQVVFAQAFADLARRVTCNCGADAEMKRRRKEADSGHSSAET